MGCHFLLPELLKMCSILPLLLTVLDHPSRSQRRQISKLYNQLQNHEELFAYIYFLQLFVLFQMLARSHVDILVGDQRMCFLLDGLVASCLHM